MYQISPDLPTQNSSLAILAISSLAIHPIVESKHKTLSEAVQIPEFHQGIAIIIVGDIDSLIFGNWILHPSTFIPPIGILNYWPSNSGQSVLALT